MLLYYFTKFPDKLLSINMSCYCEELLKLNRTSLKKIILHNGNISDLMSNNVSICGVIPDSFFPEISLCQNLSSLTFYFLELNTSLTSSTINSLKKLTKLSIIKCFFPGFLEAVHLPKLSKFKLHDEDKFREPIYIRSFLTKHSVIKTIDIRSLLMVCNYFIDLFNPNELKENIIIFLAMI